MRARAVGENGIDREHVFAGIAVAQRARAAGIVADHAADGGARGGGNVDWEPQAVRPERPIELVQHDAWLDQATAIRGVDVDDPVEIARAIEDHRAVYGLPGLRGTAAARRHRHAFGPADGERAFGVGRRSWGDHAERHDLVMRGVGGVAPAREGVEAHIAGLLRLEPPFERFFERWQQRRRQACLLLVFGLLPARVGAPADRGLTRMSHSLFNATSRERLGRALKARSIRLFTVRLHPPVRRSAENAAEFVARRRASLFADSGADAATRPRAAGDGYPNHRSSRSGICQGGETLPRRYQDDFQ